MEEINIKELFVFYISKLRIALLILFLTVLLGAVYSLVFQEAVYESVTTLVLTGTTGSTSSSNETGITQNDITLNSKLVATYREVIKSKTILKEVIATLNLNYSTEALYNMITVSSVSNTEMISISVKSKKAEEAAAIANELANAFSLKIVDIYNIDNISIIDKAEVEALPVNVNIIRQLVIYIIIGLVLGVGIIFIMFYFDTSLKDQSQIEKLGLNVLCSVPLKIEGKRGKK